MRGGSVQSGSRGLMLLSTPHNEFSKVTERGFPFDYVSAVDIAKAFGDHRVELGGRVVFAEVACKGIVVDGAVQEVAGVGGASGLNFVGDELLKFGFEGYDHCPMLH